MYFIRMGIPQKTTTNSGFKHRIKHSLDHLIHAIRYLALRMYFGHLLMYCGSLSYSLLVAFIPLTASASLFASKIYELNRTKIQIFLSQKEINALILKFLPYSTHTLDAYILKILKNAQTIGWIGTVFFFISVIGLYRTVEEIFNVTWHAGRGRPLHKNIGMILLITLLFGATFTLYVKIGSFHLFKHHLLLFFAGKVVAFFLLAFAFGILYKLIPRTPIRLRAALLGGLFAASLYEICRLFLHLYISRAMAINRLWGSLSLIPVFILIIYLLSIIIIVGNDMTFIIQNYRKMKEDDELYLHYLQR